MLKTSVGLQVALLTATFCSGLKGSPVDVGRWSEWSEWSLCSRTCGAGVSYQERSCNSGSCTGAPRQYRSCCVEDCPADTPSSRAQQCSSYNNLTHNNTEDGKMYDWKPTEEDECQLSCRSECEPEPCILVTNIASGTPCETLKGERGVCLDRMCTRVGCDGVLGSLKVEDPCLQCLEPGEDGGSCVEFSGIHITNAHVTGRVTVLTIPGGATSVSIVHPLKPGEGTLVLRTSLGSYNFHSSGSSSHEVGGVVFTYSRGQGEVFEEEKLVSTGPLSIQVTIELHNVTIASAPQVQYHYHELREMNTTNTPECNLTLHDPSSHTRDNAGEYAWEYGPFSECSVSCGTGVQTSTAQCHDTKYNRRVLSDFCNSDCNNQGGLPQPLPIQRKCHNAPCPPRWFEGEWSACSVTCGTGIQERRVECHQLVQEGQDKVVPSSHCQNLSRPAGTRPCNKPRCTVWREGEWGECSVACGQPGMQERSVVCVDLSGTELSSSACSHLPRPLSSRSCNNGPCNRTCYWDPSRWERCSNSCGAGVQQMHYRCRYSATHKKANSSCCAGLPVPREERHCIGTRKCKNLEWHTEPWGECTGECGINAGLQHRNISCGCMCGGHAVSLPDGGCNNITQPPRSRACTKDRNCHVWTHTPWSPCSTTCGPGIRERTVSCTFNGLPSTGCKESEEPYDIVVCSANPPCPLPTEPPCQDSPLPDCSFIVQMGYCTDAYLRALCCSSCWLNT